jgi:hypothetical protein
MDGSLHRLPPSENWSSNGATSLAYVVRELVPVPAPPPLANDLPYSNLHGSVEGEMIARASHTHPLFRDDNSAVYYLLEEATRGTSYAPTIKPYQRTKQGREAWWSLVDQYADQDKWEAEVKRQDDLLHNRQWKGQSNFSLEKFIAQHHNAHVSSMRQCVEHITFQLPNERTRVIYLLDAIQCNDPGLQAAMANVRTDTDPVDGKMNDFEATASYLVLPYDPLSKKRAAGNKQGLASISEVSGADDTTDVSSVTFGGNGGKSKASIGTTGVEFRYYKPPEYNQLGADQKAELKEHCDGKKSSPGPNKGKKPRNNTRDDSKHKKWIASAIEKHLAQKGQEVQDDDNAESEFKSYVMSLISNYKSPPPPPCTSYNCSRISQEQTDCYSLLDPTEGQAWLNPPGRFSQLLSVTFRERSSHAAGGKEMLGSWRRPEFPKQSHIAPNHLGNDSWSTW